MLSKIIKSLMERKKWSNNQPSSGNWPRMNQSNNFKFNTTKLDLLLGVTIKRLRVGRGITDPNKKINIVCEILTSFERASPSNFRTQDSFIHIK